MLLAAAAAQNAVQRSHDLLIKAINFAQKPGAGRVMQVVGLPAADEPKARVRPCFYGLYQITIDLQHLLSFFPPRAHSILTCAPAAQIRDPCYFSQQNAVYLYNGRLPQSACAALHVYFNCGNSPPLLCGNKTKSLCWWDANMQRRSACSNFAVFGDNHDVIGSLWNWN